MKAWQTDAVSMPWTSLQLAISMAAAQVLAYLLDLPQQALELAAMAREAAHSRLLGGIHFRHDNEVGLQLGRMVAEQVLKVYPR